MTDMKRIKEHMEVIGADGVHVGTVDRVENNRIKLSKADSGEGRHRGHHHYIDGSLVADVEGNKVRLSANGDVAVTTQSESRPHFIAVRAGTLDDPEIGKPDLTIWISSAPSWACFAEDLPRAEKQPAPPARKT